MNKLYKENGLLSEGGEVVTHPVKMAVYKLLNQDEQVKQMGESELRVLGGCLQKIVGDLISERIQFKNEVAKKLAAMKDEEFENYLKEKYGDRWILVSLTEEELDRVPRLSEEQIQNALEQGRRDREAAANAPIPYIDPGLRFR